MGSFRFFLFFSSRLGQQRRGTYMSTDPEPRWLWADDVGGWKAYTKDDSDLLEAIFVCVFFGKLVCAPPYSADRYCRLADLQSQFCYFVLSFFLVVELWLFILLGWDWPPPKRENKVLKSLRDILRNFCTPPISFLSSICLIRHQNGRRHN
jgi:hypothetical protein